MLYLGIEIGGTKLQLGIGPGDGTLVGLWRDTVDVSAGPDGIRRQIRRGIPLLLEQANIGFDEVRAVGVGFGGPVDDATHTVIKSHQIRNWDRFPLAQWMSDLLERPVALGNDADVAGLAEALFGAGKGMSPIFYITIGSGIGGGLIFNGDIYRGIGRGAAEIGHLRMPIFTDYEALDVPLEEIASGWAIQEWARGQLAKRGTEGEFLRQRVDGDVHRLTTHDVAEAAKLGDELAWQVLRRAWDSLADAICHIIALLCPRRIVIGGGVSLMGEELLFAPLRKLVAERVFNPFAGCYDIVPAALGEEVVVHGALALAKRL